MDGCTCSCALAPVVDWRVIALGAAALVRRCPACGRDRPFVSSGRFRVNASGRRLDVWLVYRCGACARTWNRPIHERVAPEALGGDLERYHRNDPALADLYAGAGAAYTVDGPVGRPLRARLAVERPVPVRLDRLLARRLGVSRAQVAQLVSTDAPLRRPVRHGTELLIHGCPMRR